MRNISSIAFCKRGLIRLALPETGKRGEGTEKPSLLHKRKKKGERRQTGRLLGEMGRGERAAAL